MTSYPFWVRIEYREFGNHSKEIGYTGSITKERDLIDVLIRLDIEIPNITKFLINKKEYPVSRLQGIADKMKNLIEEENQDEAR